MPSANTAFDPSANTAFDALREELLPLLRCPACRHDRSLLLRSGEQPAPFATPVASEHLWCLQCDERFAITPDGIPILFAESADRESSPEAADNRAANIDVYDAISHDYEQFTRRSSAIARRMISAAGRIVAQQHDATRRLAHLDFGCGPGHVLAWLRDFGFWQVGLDVSLVNLRSARRATGCLAVCGDAANMPFARDAFDVVSESSVLHHIEDWRAVLGECRRVCAPEGGVILDSEPSREQMAWSPLARAVFAMRFPVYKALSYVRRDKYMFRDLKQAQLNLLAEIHHQPGTGFPVDEIERMFVGDGFSIDVIRSPTPELSSQARPNWKSVLLNVLSARNPYRALYGPFTAVAISLRARAPASASRSAERPMRERSLRAA